MATQTFDDGSLNLIKNAGLSPKDKETLDSLYKSMSDLTKPETISRLVMENPMLSKILNEKDIATLKDKGILRDETQATQDMQQDLSKPQKEEKKAQEEMEL